MDGGWGSLEDHEDDHGDGEQKGIFEDRFLG